MLPRRAMLTLVRVMSICFLLCLVIGPEASKGIPYPYMIPLPSNKALWEAGTRDTWKATREELFASQEATQPRLYSLGDLFVAQNSAALYNNTNDAQIGLSEWHAGADGLGMMLTAITAGM